MGDGGKPEGGGPFFWEGERGGGPEGCFTSGSPFGGSALRCDIVDRVRGEGMNLGSS